MLSQGVVLGDRYRLNERVATGGMGEVWWGTDVLLKRKVAVKVLLPALVSDEQFITRFRTEARTMAAMRNPGIVQIYDYGENALVDGSRVDYLVMEYIEGGSLGKWLHTAGRLGVAETLYVVTQAARALQVAHEAGIVHRDVKPGNLLVQPDGSVVLVDFGVARSTAGPNLTGTDIVLGSASYIAPEQALGRPVSPATDVYALGVVAYRCLAGRLPFLGDDPLRVVNQHLHDAPPPLPAEVPAPVVELVTRALAKDPAARYPSAAAFADAADAALGVGPATPPAGLTVPLSGVATGPVPSSPVPNSPVPNFPAPIPAAPAPAGDGRRRRNLVLAGATGTALIGLLGLFAVLVPRSVADRPAGPEQSPGVPSAAATDGGGAASGVIASASAPPSPGRSPRPTGKATPTPTATAKSPAPTFATQRNPYQPGQVCGAGYQVVDSAPLNGSDGAPYGTVYLMRNAGARADCAVALKNTSVGRKTAVTAYLEVRGQQRSTDSGQFDYYAGPVRATTGGNCVKWGGSAGGAAYDSPFEHCG